MGEIEEMITALKEAESLAKIELAQTAGGKTYIKSFNMKFRAIGNQEIATTIEKYNRLLRRVGWINEPETKPKPKSKAPVESEKQKDVKPDTFQEHPNPESVVRKPPQ